MKKYHLPTEAGAGRDRNSELTISLSYCVLKSIAKLASEKRRNSAFLEEISHIIYGL